MYYSNQHRKTYKKTALLSLAVFLVTIFIFLALLHIRGKEYLPATVRGKISAALYYPVNTPQGMHVDRASFQSPAKDVLVFTITDSQDNKFYVSEEPLPANYSLSKFKEKFPVTENLQTSVGNALIGTLSNEIVASLPTTKNTWLIVNTTATDQHAELEAICRSFVKING